MLGMTWLSSSDVLLHAHQPDAHAHSSDPLPKLALARRWRRGVPHCRAPPPPPRGWVFLVRKLSARRTAGVSSLKVRIWAITDSSLWGLCHGGSLSRRRCTAPTRTLHRHPSGSHGNRLQLAAVSQGVSNLRLTDCPMCIPRPTVAADTNRCLLLCVASFCLRPRLDRAHGTAVTYSPLSPAYLALETEIVTPLPRPVITADVGTSPVARRAAALHASTMRTRWRDRRH